MNQGHRELCASEDWFGYLRDELVPWMLGDRDLGERGAGVRSRSGPFDGSAPLPLGVAHGGRARSGGRRPRSPGRFIGTNVVVLEGGRGRPAVPATGGSRARWR